MATTKITDLTAYTDPINTDVLPIVDITSDVTKKVSIANVMKNASLGSAAAPGISFDGDPNTGIYSPGANQVAVSTDGTARLTASTTAITAAIPVDVLLGSASTPSYTFTGDLNTGIYSPGADQVAISTNGTGQLFVDSSGRVGVGGSQTAFTAGPGNSLTKWVGLQAQDATTTQGFWLLNQDATFRRRGSFAIDPVNNTVGIYTQASSGNVPDITFTTATFERFRITSDGKVGVGTSSPDSPLQVIGNTPAHFRRTSAGFCNVLLSASTAQWSTGVHSDGYYAITHEGVGERLRIDSSGRLGVGTTSPVSNLHINSGSTADRVIYIQGSSFGLRLGAGVAGGSIEGVDATNGNTSFQPLTVNGSTLLLSTGGSERARIDSSGRLGIGDSAPVSTLTVRGTGGSIAGINTHVLVSDSTAMATGVGGSILFEGAYSTGGDRAVYAAIAGTKENGTNFNYAGNLKFYTRSGSALPSVAMTIDSSQRVGIGTTSPAHKLVVSNGGVQSIEFNWDGASTNFIQSYNRSTSQYLPLSFYSSQHIFFNGANNSESGRFDSSGRLLVGTSSAVTGGTAQFSRIVALGNSAGATNPGVISLGMGATPASGNPIGRMFFVDNGAGEYAEIAAYCDGTPGSGDYPGRLVFSTTADGASSPTERMRITSEGRALIGTTNTSPVSANVAGTMINSNGEFQISRDSGTPLLLNRKTNDGNMVEFWQDGTNEGSISISGTTVSYNGAHLSRWSQLPSGATRTEILRGSVLSNIDEMCEWGDEENEQLNRMKVSDVEGDKNVSGVFQAWDDDDDTYTNDFYCAMTGDFIIRIGAGVTVERGDLLMSAGDGTAKPQDDDIIRSKTIAKVTSTNVSCTYDDGSYCVPCVLMAC